MNDHESEDEYLAELIGRWVRTYHRGRENAIKRDRLLEQLRRRRPTLSDRKMRMLYCEIPVVTSGDGIFWPIRFEEIDEFRSYLRKKAIALFDRNRMVREVHRGLIPVGVQFNLFEKEEMNG